MTLSTAGGAGAAMPLAPARRRVRGHLVWPLTLAVVGLVAGVALWVAPGSHDLRVQVVDQGSGAILAEHPVEEGGRFELRHTHSVTNREVIETFSASSDDGVAIEELWFDQHGANLPTGAERIGDTVTTYLEEEDGGVRVLHHGHAVGTLPLIVGSPSVDHRLLFGDGDELRLLDVARSGARVEVRLEGPR